MSVFEQLASVSLEETVVAADLQSRVDRKYLVEPEVVEELAHDFAGLSVLEIDGSRQFAYESVYFDTPDLAAYHGAALSRRRRFKVRRRTYLDSGQAVFEVKTRGLRNRTVKDRLALPASAPTGQDLSPDQMQFVASVVGPLASLAPVLRNRYRRSTLVDFEQPFRVAIDDDVEAFDIRTGQSVAYLPTVIVETKSAGQPTPVDRWFWRRGHRPVGFSKYCTSLALLNRSLPSNKWHRTMKQFGV